MKELLKRMYQFDRPGWDTLKKAIAGKWDEYCDSSVYPATPDVTNFSKGRASVWKEIRDLMSTIESET